MQTCGTACHAVQSGTIPDPVFDLHAFATMHALAMKNLFSLEDLVHDDLGQVVVDDGVAHLQLLTG